MNILMVLSWEFHGFRCGSGGRLINTCFTAYMTVSIIIMILHIQYLPPHHKIDMIETLDVRYHQKLVELIHLQQQHQMVVVQLLLIVRYAIKVLSMIVGWLQLAPQK